MVVGIAGDTKENLKNMCKYGFIFISDVPKNSLGKEYNTFYLEMKKIADSFLKRKISIPITYLINKKGIIVWKYVGTREKRPSNIAIFRKIDKNL